MQIRRWGNEVLVNTVQAGVQHRPQLARLADGRLVAVWRDEPTGLFRARFLDALGTAQGGEIAIGGGGGTGRESPAVAGLAGGGFYLTWTEHVGPVANYILGRVFNAAGTVVREQPVVFSTAGDGASQVAGLATGGSVVAWVRTTDPGFLWDVSFRVFDAGGAGGPLVAAAPGYPSDFRPAVAGAPSGHFVVAWNDSVENPDIRVRVLSPAGAASSATAVLAELDVLADHPVADQIRVAWLNDRQFVVVWDTDTEYFGRTVQLAVAQYVPGLGPGGALAQVTGVVELTPATAGDQDAAQVAALPGARFVVAWRDLAGPLAAIRLQVFDSFGTRIGEEMLLGTTTAADTELAIAALADGRVAVTWTARAPGSAETDIRLQIIDPRDGVVTGGASDDVLYGHDLVEDEIIGLAGNDALHGLGGDDVLDGGAGDDWLDGGPGLDLMRGGIGNDTLVLDQAGDVLFERPLQGNDTVQTGAFSIDLARYLNTENVTLTGTLALAARGNTGTNILNGETNSAPNLLTGLGGNDIYIVGAGDVVVEAVGGGTDTVQSGTLSLNLAAYSGIENIILTGALALSATGNAGANAIDGERNTATNVLTGLAGDDTYTVGAGDTVVEAAVGGTDTVQSATLSLNLAQFPQVENARLLGALPLSATGTAGANTLDGAENGAANVLVGLGGNDIYVVGPGDTVAEAPGSGTDRVESALIGIDLAAYPNTEWLLLRGSLPLSGKGTGAGDILDGSFNSAANVLVGLGGNDIYVVGAGDTVVEAPGGGTDRVQAWNISLDLANYPNVENATLTGATALNLTGTAGPNLLTGNASANTIAGLGGGDTLAGLGGTDVLIGGAGADNFRFLAPSDSAVGAARDTIQAFNPAEGDRIDLSAIDANGALAGDPAFAFLGTAAFTGAQGQLRYDVAGPDVILQGTITGGVASFEIRVAGFSVLSAGDIIL